jgi:hypothetical protein
MATTTNYGWTTPDDTALVKDGAAAIRTLGTSVDTTTKALNPSTTLGDIEYRSSSANTNTRLAIGTTGQVLTVAGGVPAWATPGATRSFAVFRDEKAFGTAGGTFTSGAWRTRDINSTQINNITGASIASNQITLPAGTYYVWATTPAYSVFRYSGRLQNITDSTTTLISTTGFANTSGSHVVNIFINGQFTIASEKTFEVQNRCSDTKNGDGYGTAGEQMGDTQNSLYSTISIEKIG